MSPVKAFPPVGQSTCCDVLPGGHIHIHAPVMARLKNWRAGDQGDAINVSYLADEGLLVLLFAKTSGPGYKLHHLNRSGTAGSGGELRCARLSNRILSKRVELPMNDIPPIVLEDKPWPWHLALFLQRPTWSEAEFTQAGATTVPSIVGMYALMNADQNVYRYGCGQLQTRFREHLKNGEHTRATKAFRYFPCQIVQMHR